MRKNKLILLTLLGCLLLVVVSCGGEATPTATPLPTDTPAQPTTTPSPPLPTATMLPSPVLGPTATVTGAVSVANALTATIAPTSTVIVSDVQNTAQHCDQEPDLDLASYQDPGAQLGCPVAPATFDPVAINEFGSGPEFDRFMLWFSTEKQIYVLQPDKHWQAYPDTWSEDQPIFACNPFGGKADSPPLPRRGFGKLWCSVANLQQVMGKVAKEERLCQHTVVQQFAQGRLLGCYEDATIRYIRLLDDGRWDTVLTR